MNGLLWDLRRLYIFGATQIHFLEVNMKRKVLCIALALLMCMMVILPTFADDETGGAIERASITASYGLTHVSGSTYKMWAKINNPSGYSVTATLSLYDASYNYITSISTTSSNTTINLSKKVTLSSGTYHLRLNYTVSGSTTSSEKSYTI